MLALGGHRSTRRAGAADPVFRADHRLRHRRLDDDAGRNGTRYAGFLVMCRGGRRVGAHLRRGPDPGRSAPKGGAIAAVGADASSAGRRVPVTRRSGAAQALRVEPFVRGSPFAWRWRSRCRRSAVLGRWSPASWRPRPISRARSFRALPPEVSSRVASSAGATPRWSTAGLSRDRGPPGAIHTLRRTKRQPRSRTEHCRAPVVSSPLRDDRGARHHRLVAAPQNLQALIGEQPAKAGCG